MHDAAVRKAIELETQRQTHNIELIASENYVSRMSWKPSAPS